MSYAQRHNDTSLETMHRYYTPKPIDFQADLAIFTIFVNYADFYVNIIMLTEATTYPA